MADRARKNGGRPAADPAEAARARADAHGPARAADDLARAAIAAGLRYVNDDEPGLYRHRRGKGWSYHKPDGTLIDEVDARERIESLAIPPAWTDVWICPDGNGHIQATGRDDRGRKQYRYHPRWREVRNATKFYRMIRFGEALPRIRERVEADLRRLGLPRDKVLAAVIRLLETTLVRVGNEEYKRENGTFGLTTLRDRHVEFDGSEVRFRFAGKGGEEQEASVRDGRLAKIVRECQEIPGYELFQYYDDEGEKRAIGSVDVNAYLKEAGGADFTAKDFRTWAGTVHAFRALCEAGPAETDKETKARTLAAIDYVAERLRNTRDVCRSFYVHPGVLESYEAGWLCSFAEDWEEPGTDEEEGGAALGSSEAALLALLREVDRRARGEAGSPAERSAVAAALEG